MKELYLFFFLSLASFYITVEVIAFVFMFARALSGADQMYSVRYCTVTVAHSGQCSFTLGIELLAVQSKH